VGKGLGVAAVHKIKKASQKYRIFGGVKNLLEEEQIRDEWTKIKKWLRRKEITDGAGGVPLHGQQVVVVGALWGGASFSGKGKGTIRAKIKYTDNERRAT